MALTFNGTTDKILYGDVPQSGNFTYSMWINPASLPAAGELDQICSFYDESESEPYGTFDKTITLDESGIIRLYIYTGSTPTASTTTAISSGTAYHVAATVDGSNMRVFLNGSNEGTTAAGSSYTGYSNPGLGVAIKPNAYAPFDGGKTITRFNGDISELAFWSSVALTTQEIASLSKGFSPILVRPASLSLYTTMVRSADNRKGSGGTATGTTPASHPRIIYPRRRQAFSVTAAAPASAVGHYYRTHLMARRRSG